MFSFQKVINYLLLLQAIALLNGVLFAQEKSELDSLFNFYIKARGVNPEGISSPASSHDTTIHKCGFGAAASLHLSFDRLTKEEQGLLKPLLNRPILDTSFVSPQGYFRIHYRKSGTSVPKYDLNEFAIACDSAYNFEVNHLGFPPPPPDNGAGGDNRYDIYLLSLSGTYGYTQPEAEVIPGKQKYISHIVVNSDFTGFFTTGINAARVTIAHELHHAIQMGNYIVRESNSTITDLFFYEITSTAMEEFVFDSVNDYYGYMKDNTRKFYGYTGTAFSSNDGYNLAVWNIFLRDKFGYPILKRQWELLVDNRALKAIDNSLIEKNSSFNESLNLFNVWTFFSSFRALPGKYFKEAINYPPVKIQMTAPFMGNERSISLMVNPTSSTFIGFVSNQSSLDSIIVAVTNSDVNAGVQSPTSLADVQYTLYSHQTAGSFKITDKYFAKLNVSAPTFWSTAEFLNNELAKDGNITSTEIETPYPSPFFYSKSSFVFFPLSKISEPECELFIYSTAMKFIHSETMTVEAAKKRIRWDGKDRGGNKLASGVYIYAINYSGSVHKGKLVIFND